MKGGCSDNHPSVLHPLFDNVKGGRWEECEIEIILGLMNLHVHTRPVLF
jgi:hypothetical protein